MTTTSHAITQATNKKLFDRVAALGIKEGWLFKDEARANARGILDAEKIHHVPGLGFLGSRVDRLYGSIHGTHRLIQKDFSEYTGKIHKKRRLVKGLDGYSFYSVCYQTADNRWLNTGRIPMEAPTKGELDAQ